MQVISHTIYRDGAFSAALNSPVTRLMCDLIYHVLTWLTERYPSPYETTCKLYQIPMSANNYTNS